MEPIKDAILYAALNMSGRVVYSHESRENVEMNAGYIKTPTRVVGLAAIDPPVAAGSVDTGSKHDVCRESERLYRQSAKDAIERAEKAEADLKQVNEWRAAALVSNQQLYELMEAKLTKAEARAAHLEHFFKHHSVQVPPQYTALHTMEDSSANKK